MNRRDAARWKTARTLPGLAALTAAWLNGEIQETPGHMGPPMPETRPLIPVLTAVNRAGYLTENSQPGEPADENGSAQRAAVSGFADSGTFAALTAAIAGADLMITAARAPRDGGNWGPLTAITLDMGEEFTWDGGAVTQDILRDSYSPHCHPDAVRALCDAWQVTLIDPQWGRNDVLWPLLGAFAAQRDHGHQ